MPIRRTTTAYKNTARKTATLLESSPEAQRISSIVFRCLCAIALVYAFLAGLRTINDYDLGWQMAMGRFIALHHTLPSTDIFSYTAPGKPWIYPILSELIFYGVFKIGGYALLSWMGAAASAATVMILLRRSSIAIAALAILAVPPIAEHTGPRADMFTLLMFAGFLKILWQHHRQSDGVRLWLLPVLMIFWVNLHLGFIAGLALFAAFFILETAEIFFFGARRATAIKKVKTAWPWLLLTFAATWVNPWGWTIYLAIYRQYKALAFHDRWITEWSSLPLHWESIANIFDIRDTNGTQYILLAVAAVSLMIAIFQRKLVEATLLVGASYLVSPLRYYPKHLLVQAS